MSKWRERKTMFGVVLASLLLTVGASVSADTLQSAHYQLIESDVGGGGLVQSSSPNYTSVLSIGDTAVGDSSSASYQTKAGSQTTPDPSLSFVINNAGASFNSVFSPTQTAVATNTFSVSNYTSYGYTVQIVGHTPTNGSHVIPAMGTDADGGPAAPTPGKEEFGLNLVANTSPSSFGANPDQGQFGEGTFAANYGLANHFRFVNGETIATAKASSGVTTYTISYVVDVSSMTPGGMYTSDQQLVVVGTY